MRIENNISRLQISSDYNKQEMFNLKKDPNETTNLLSSGLRVKQVAALRERLVDLFKTQMVEADYPAGPILSESDPQLYGNVLSPGWCQPKI